ncbi:MAG: glycosyltransferase family 2 protein [Clostridia bacterium]|nr:glycosyltransferase family 2 protein [Clostridia bacterium]
MISIICPVYNTEKYLNECVNSVIAQDFSDWELLLIDDGSTDKSPRICDDFAGKDKRIKVFHKKNEGQWITREFGIEKSQGDHFIFLDSDDLLETGALSVINNFILKYNASVYLYDISKLNADGSKTCLQELYEEKFLQGSKNIIEFCFIKNNCISLCVYCFKKSFYSSCLTTTDMKKDIRSQEDFLMLFNVLQQTNELSVIPKVLYLYRTNLESASNSLIAKDYYENILISSYIYRTIFDKYRISLNSCSDKIINRLSWQPISFIKRAYREFSLSEQRKSFNIIRKSFIYKNYTLKYKFKSKKDRVFFLFFKLRFHLMNKILFRK